MKKVAFYTLGCKVNSYETESLKREYINNGWEIVDFLDKADKYIINSCIVTNMAEAKSRKAANKAKKLNPDAEIEIVGCMKKIEKPTSEQKELTNKHSTKIGNISSKTRALLKIQDGCNNFCSYCIIPYARSREVSRDFNSIISEAREIAKFSKEIVLVGIHVSSYKYENKTLTDVVDEIAKIEGIQRIRLGSLEPHDITDDFILRAKLQPKLCPHFHISLQSGCNETLKRMNRKYTFEEYYEVIKKLRTIENCNVTTDVIVGFIGETDDEFNESLNNIKKCEFGKIHVFPFSKRSRTKASSPEFIKSNGGEVDSVIKKERAMILGDYAKEAQKTFLEKQVGKTFSVIMEEKNATTANYIKVKVNGIPNEIFEVTITSAYDDYCIGNR